MKVEESLNETFDESPPPTKLSPLVDDDVGEEEAIENYTKGVNNNNEEDESIEVDEVVNIKESKNHLLDQVIGNLNQRTLRYQAKNHTNDVWDLVPLPMSQSFIGTKWVFRNKLNENSIVSRNKARYQNAKRISTRDYKKTLAYMSKQLKDIYRALESRYIHQERTIDQSFYRDLGYDSVAKFTNLGFDCLLHLDEQICLRNLKANMTKNPFDEHYVLVPRKMSSLKAKQQKKPPPKKTRNVGKSKHTQLTTSFSSDSPPSNNGDLPSTKLSSRSYCRAIPHRTNMSDEQREIRGMFKNLARALYKFAKMLKKGCR
ncbi:hypothetical protein Tco_0626397 [Tanacetum coccineum]|uniref:Reverse transcriptase Ty1/copia-type domain-containing protein n=1 Tax=Tanacetum coccineum TaxID=301880 RepID=A0ABQ4WJF8_9ASTR